jgi:hypothetical protein
MFFVSLSATAGAYLNDPDVGPSPESLISSYDAALQALAQNVNTQPLPVDLSAELTKQIDAAGLTPISAGLLSTVAELQKQIDALNSLPPPAQGTLTAVTATAPVVSSGGTAPDISMPAASTSVNGYLTSTDWNTFNGKAPATSGTSILYGNGSGGFSNVTIGSGVSFAGGTLSATGSGGTVTSVTATTPLASSGGTNPNLTIQQSSASQSGYLSSTDWSTFNNKQPAGAYLTAVTSDAPLTGAGTVASHLSMPAATTSVSGYLTSTDWNTFNNKGSGTVTSVTGTAPVVSSGGTTPAISMAAATTSVSGYLTSTDWNTFNNKQPAGAYLTAVTSDAPLTGSGTSASHLSMPAATTSVNGYLTSTDWNTFNNKQAAGTYVTTVSVVSANGFAGTSSGGATPAITLTTSINGLLKGNGTAISAAVANTDYVPLSTVLTKTADYTITNTDTWIINNKSGSAMTLTFPAASAWPGRYITVKNMQPQLVNSASSNIVPIDSTTAGTAILLAVVGNWATMVSDGTNWVIMQAAPNNILLLE